MQTAEIWSIDKWNGHTLPDGKERDGVKIKREEMRHPDLTKAFIELIKENKLCYQEAVDALEEAKFVLQFCDVTTNPCE